MGEKSNKKEEREGINNIFSQSPSLCKVISFKKKITKLGSSLHAVLVLLSIFFMEHLIKKQNLFSRSCFDPFSDFGSHFETPGSYLYFAGSAVLQVVRECPHCC